MVKLNKEADEKFYCDDPRTIVVPAVRKKHWAVMIDLMTELDRICTKHGLRWFVDGGTLLGAVRHGGFIPWDDDVDVNMPREDYEKLCKIAPVEFEDPYFFQTNDTDHEWMNLYARLCNSDTTAIAKAILKNGKTTRKNNQGIFIDIFPLDKVPDDWYERKRFLATISMADKKRWYRVAALRLFREPSRRMLAQPLDVFKFIYGGFIAGVKRFLGIDLVNKAYHEVHSLSRRYEDSDFKCVAEVAFIPDICQVQIYPESKYVSGNRISFEYIDVPVPLEPEKYLEIAFGDWQTHVVGTGLHGDLFIDVDNSYRKYLK